MTYTVAILDLEFEIEVDSWSAFDPGRTSGPPENCYPPEGGEVEWHVDEDFRCSEFIQAALDNNEDWCEKIHEQLYEQLSSHADDYPEPDPWDD